MRSYKLFISRMEVGEFDSALCPTDATYSCGDLQLDSHV
jgi:hypothetical protein